MNNNSEIIVAIRCITYNHEPYISECLDGFVMQKTNFKFVAIVHDDASTDATAAIIREYAEKYPDIIKPILETENQYSKKDGSLGRIMSNAVIATGAKYVAMCEGDDYWIDPYKLQKQVDFMDENEDIGICYTDYNRLVEPHKDLVESLYEKCKSYRATTYEQFLLKPGYLAPMTWLYRINLVEHINKSKIYSDGTYAYMLEFMYNSKVAYIPEVTAVYRAHEGSASAPISVEAQFNYRLGIYKTQNHYAKKYPCEEELQRKIHIRSILNILPDAVRANKADFINDAQLYMEDNGLDIKAILKDLIQGEKCRKSYAYRLGKKLLFPLSLLRKIIGNYEG